MQAGCATGTGTLASRRHVTKSEFKMNKGIIALCFLTCTMAYGQVLQSGLILPNNYEDEGICCIYAPSNGFTIYDQPNGEITGKLTRNAAQNTDNQSYYRIYFVDDRNKTETQIELENFWQIGYEIWALTYNERQNGFVKLKIENQNLWLKESEVKNMKFELVEWQTFLSDNAGKVLGFYANEPGLNLREQPNTSSRIIKTLRGDLHEISPTNEHIGLWTKVKVIIMKEHPCETELTEEENIEEILEGWIKILDDDGLPNVWNYSRGC